jgi:radical SAM-linked protein
MGAPLSRHLPNNPSAAAVQKLRLRYTKRGRLRFTSHRDIARTFERALRRAGVPMAYSQGFSPHPKVSWVGAAPTGVASEAEYVEVSVVEQVDPEALKIALDEALPPGIDVVDIVEAHGGNLTERIDASEWRIELDGVEPDELAKAVSAFLAAEVVEVERLTKNGTKTLDVRPAVVSALVEPRSSDAGHDKTALSQPCGILMTVVRQVTPTVRPDDVLNALRVVADLVPPVPARATRMAQGRLDGEGRLVDPLQQDKES